MDKQCGKCSTNFTIYEDDLKFYDKNLPTPTLCPTCRNQRRLAFRNERSIYKSKCDLCRKDIITIYHEDTPVTKYCTECWWSDKWSAEKYAKDFDFKRPFFEQFKEFVYSVPKMACIQQGENQNSVYTNCASNNKNCYLTFAANSNEDCLYSNWINKSRDSIDNYNLWNSELAYQCIDCTNSYDIQYCQKVHNTHTARFSYDCRNCHNIFACVGLRNKNYFVLNKQVTKEEYKALLVSPQKQKEVLSKYNELYLSVPRLYTDFINSENFSGSYISNSKNVHFCRDVIHLEDCKYCDNFEFGKDSYDVSYYGVTGVNERCYEVEGSGHGLFNILFSKLIWGGCNNIYYSYECFSSNNLFGCSGLKKAEYSIFNKKYSKEDYEELTEKIIDHMKDTKEWGEFFPGSFSPFGYNETRAQDEFPLDKEKALAKGFKWRDPDPKEYLPQTYKVPENIKDIPDSITKEILACSDCTKNYKIVLQELNFYRKMKLSIPKKCPDCRHRERIKRRTQSKLWDRNCDKCKKEVQTVYSPQSPEKVYCEKCYYNEIG